MNENQNEKVIENLLNKVLPLQGKHIFTRNFGDGEINVVTKKNDGTGIYVYFDSNLEGEIKLDGEEFLQEVEEVKEIER